MPDITLHFRATGKYPLPNPPTLSMARALQRSMVAFGIESAAVAVETASEIETAAMEWAAEDLKWKSRLLDGDTADLEPEFAARNRLISLCQRKMAGGGKCPDNPLDI